MIEECTRDKCRHCDSTTDEVLMADIPDGHILLKIGDTPPWFTAVGSAYDADGSFNFETIYPDANEYQTVLYVNRAESNQE